MDIITSFKHYMIPAIVSVVAVGLLKIGLFVTHGDLEQSLRQLENAIRSEYATQQDIQDIKSLLQRVDIQLSRLEDRLDRALQFSERKQPGGAQHAQ